MAERIIANLTLDTYQRNKIPPLVIPQHDYGARYIRVRITEQGENVSVASGSVVSIIAKRMADGQSAAFSGSVNADGSVLVPVAQWMLDAPSDDVDCHVAVTGTGYQYSTTSFVISPQERENPSYLEEDDPRVNIVEEALIKVVEEADRAEEQADLAQSAASTAASDAKEAARQEVEQLVGQLGIVQTLGNSRMAVVSQAVTTGLYNRNAKRIANLEQGFNEQFETDDSVAYVKDAPENALPYAEVKKVGGMTRKCTNLIPFPYVDTTKISLGITYTDNGDGTIACNGTSTGFSQFNFLMDGTSFKDGNRYTVSPADPHSGVRIRIHYKDANGKEQWVTTVDWETGFEFIRVYVSVLEGTTLDNVVIKPMLNEGSTALPYEPYFEGLRSAKVTEVESVGENLINIEDAVAHRGSISVENDAIKWTCSADMDHNFAFSVWVDVKPNTHYHIEWNYTNAIDRVFLYSDKLGNTKVQDDSVRSGGAFDTKEHKRILIGFYVTNSVASGYTETVSNIMLNEGERHLPYTPYVKHTLPIPVEVRGSENLIPYPYEFSEINENDITGRIDADQKIIINGAATTKFSKRVAQFTLPKGTYTLSSVQPNAYTRVYFYKNGTRIQNQSNTDEPFTFTSENESDEYTAYIFILTGVTFTNGIWAIMINEGTTALPYEPYSTVKGLDGYGLGVSDTVYNYIDWEKKQFVKRCAMVDLGTLKWYKTQSGNNTYTTSVYGMQNAKTDEEQKQGWICEKYNASIVVDNTKLDNKSAIRYTSDCSFYIRDDDYTDEETFKTAMSGVMLVYELATPEVTDISSLITEDNFIGVEGNGTLTFKNAYEYSVPSEVEYQLEV